MLQALQDAGVQEVMSSHIYKKIPNGFEWKAYQSCFVANTTKSSSRGWYSIALKEVQEVVSLKEVQEVVSLKEVMTNSAGVEWLPTQTEKDLEMYSTDTGLQRIALMGNKCFGEYSSNAKQCNGCPLSGSCQVAGFAKIAILAAELDAQTLKDLTPAKVIEEIEQGFSKEDPKEEAFREVEPEGWKLMKDNVISSICSKCESVIPAGTDCINIRGQGNYHTGCAE